MRCAGHVLLHDQVVSAGYAAVTYRELTGGHIVPPPVRQQATDWLLRG